MVRYDTHTCVIAPAGAEEAAAVLAEATEAARKGVQLRIGLVESPYLGHISSKSVSGQGLAAKTADAAADRPREPGIPFDIASRGGTILLSHDRMNGIIEISRPDLLAVAQGGVRWGELAAAISGEGLCFPHTPEGDMSIAGVWLHGTIFPTEGGFGPLRESILSLELVTPMGEIVRFGSRAIKDVGGYELIGFLLGQGGRCGFISSVTLRLLPAPACRIFVAGTGEVRMLKTIAHNARREFRLSSTVIYEGESAALIARMWRERLGEEGKRLPSLLEPDGEALLIGEMQGLEHVLEAQLHRLAGAERLGGASLALLDGELAGISKRMLRAAVEKLGARSSALHISYDGGTDEAPPAGSFVYRSLYPERTNAVVPIRRIEKSSRAVEAIKDDTHLVKLLSRISVSLGRERVYVMEVDGEELRRVRIQGNALLGLAAGEDAGERRERAEALSELNEEVFRAFDPEAIMLS